MMPLVPPLSTLLLFLLPSFLRRFLLPSFNFSIPPLTLPPFLSIVSFRGTSTLDGEAGAVECLPGYTKLAWILHGDALEIGNRVRDSRHVQGCSCICNKFRVFLFAFSFPIVRCVESRLRNKIEYRVWRKVYSV